MFFFGQKDAGGLYERARFRRRGRDMMTTLCERIEAGDISAVRNLLEQFRHEKSTFDINAPCDPNAYQPLSPLLLVLRAKNEVLAKLILEQPGLDIARSLPRYGTWHWIQSASLEMLKLFYAHPASDPNAADGDGQTALHAAVSDREGITKVTYLLERGATPDPKQIDGTTPLYRAALNGNSAGVETLFQYPVDVNNCNADNLWSALIVAVAHDRCEIVKQFVRRPELNVNAGSDVGDTALHIAADRGCVASVRLLLERSDIKLNEKNNSGWTPLIKAAFADRVDVVSLLCARTDLVVNAVDVDRQTALHWAVLAQNIGVVRVLLTRPDLNLSITNRPEKHTALDLARAMQCNAIAELLEQRPNAVVCEDEISPRDTYEPPATPVSIEYPIEAAIADPAKDEVSQ